MRLTKLICDSCRDVAEYENADYKPPGWQKFFVRRFSEEKTVTDTIYDICALCIDEGYGVRLFSKEQELC